MSTSRKKKTKSEVKSIQITENEMVKLLYHFASTGTPLNFDFGPGWAALTFVHIEGEPLPDTVMYLAQLRGVLNENCDGDGI